MSIDEPYYSKTQGLPFYLVFGLTERHLFKGLEGQLQRLQAIPVAYIPPNCMVDTVDD